MIKAGMIRRLLRVRDFYNRHKAALCQPLSCANQGGLVRLGAVRARLDPRRRLRPPHGEVERRARAHARRHGRAQARVTRATRRRPAQTLLLCRFCVCARRHAHVHVPSVVHTFDSTAIYGALSAVNVGA